MKTPVSEKRFCSSRTSLVEHLMRIHTLLGDLLQESQDNRRRQLTEDAITEITAARSLLKSELQAVEAADARRGSSASEGERPIP